MILKLLKTREVFLKHKVLNPWGNAQSSR